MYLKLAGLGLVGLCAGAVVAAGLFAFMVTVGVVVRIIAKSHTSVNSRFYEDCIAVGATVGNLYYFYQWPLPGGNVFLSVFGLFSGIYVGCLVMALAETVNAIPVMSRRLRLAVGLQYLILSVAIGKAIGALIYFAKGFAA
ncbi:MAG: stage V sporulation protein AB [Lachnospiraceae bacterium]|nr:stage V sporulation protein AB [Lachnospiraceae bacterium]